MKHDNVDVLVVHRNGEKILDNCLKSLKKTKYPNFKISLLLNQSEDNSEETAKKHGIKFYSSNENLGFAGGANYLIKKTKAKYIALINNDTEVDKNWLSELVEFAEKNKMDACQPKILSLRNKKMFEYAGAAGGFVDKYGYPFCRGRIFNDVEEDAGQYNDGARIFWACGSCMLIRRDVLRRTGLFDEEYFMYAEELDLCWRINLIGGKIGFAPSSKVYHLGNYSIRKEKSSLNKEFLVHRNTLLTFLKNSSHEALKKLLPMRIIFELANSIIYPSTFPPIFKSFYWIIRNVGAVKKKRRAIQSIRKANDEEFCKLILDRSIIIEYFIRGKNKFSQLRFC